MKLARPVLYLALTTLLATCAQASVPSASVTLVPFERLSAPSLSAALSIDSLEQRDDAPRFALGAVSLLGEPRSERFHITGDELRPQPLTVFEPSYPKTRVGVFDFLGAPLVGVSSGVSHELHWGCGDSRLGTPEGIGNFLSEDPAGPIDSENRYAFVAWRPHEATDPTGEVAVAIPILLGVLYGINHATSEIDRATAIDPRASLWGAAARGLGRGAVVSAFAYATGGWGGGGAGSLGGALARGAVGGVASGLVTYGAEDVYSRIVQGYALDPSGYVSSGALGGVFGAVGGGFAYRSRSYAIGERMPNGMLAGEGPGAALRNGPEFGRTSGTTKRGLTYELEGGDQRVRRRISAAEVFEDSLAGAYSDIASGRRVVPALGFDPPRSLLGWRRNPYLRVDGVDPANAQVLIDRKLSLVRFPTRSGPMIPQATRIRETLLALDQNPGFRLVYEFPDAAAARSARSILRELGVADPRLTVRIAQ